VLLAESERSSFPVADLLDFTDALTEEFQGYFGQSSLLLHETDLAVVGLGIDESLHVSDELEMRVLSRELLHI